MKFLIACVSLLAPAGLTGQSLTMLLVNPQLDGNQITYNVSAEDFTGIIGMQYAMVYDADKLSFVSFANFNISDLDNGDFNPNQPGVIRTAWIETSLEGVTVDDGTVLYQIVFELQGSDPGNVCFSEDPMVFEFIKETGDLTSFFIVDDCHPEPFEIMLTTSVDELGERFGLWVHTLASRNTITFELDQPLTLSFRIYDMSGKLMAAYDAEEWPAGPQTIYRKDLLAPGMYVLAGDVGGEPFAVKVVCQE